MFVGCQVTTGYRWNSFGCFRYVECVNNAKLCSHKHKDTHFNPTKHVIIFFKCYMFRSFFGLNM